MTLKRCEKRNLKHNCFPEIIRGSEWWTFNSWSNSLRTKRLLRECAMETSKSLVQQLLINFRLLTIVRNEGVSCVNHFNWNSILTNPTGRRTEPDTETGKARIDKKPFNIIYESYQVLSLVLGQIDLLELTINDGGSTEIWSGLLDIRSHVDDDVYLLAEKKPLNEWFTRLDSLQLWNRMRREQRKKM